jgi:hypothetical protein
MQTERLFFPSKGRLERRVAMRKQQGGLVFRGSVYSFWWGPLCQFLVFEKV